MLPLLRKAIPFITIAIIAVAAYDGWIFYSRWSSAHEREKAGEAKEAEDARKVIDSLGGAQLKILDFYASPATIRRGQQAHLCYGVNNAKTVRIEPEVEDLHPAISHCLTVSPARTTEYKLTADDGAGHIDTRRIVLKVAP